MHAIRSAAERVLVVDDEKTIATTLATILAGKGFEARYALSAEEALRVARDFLPDILLTDLVMPGGADGVDLIREMRRFLPGCRALLITAHGGLVLQDPRYEKIRVIQKPIPPAELISMLQEVAAGGSPQRYGVLLVEDRETKRYSLARWLRHNGFEVREAETGAEALQQAVTPVDCVLLDINLPDTDGFKLCKELRRRGVLAPIVHVTATRCDEAAERESKSCGADGFVAQPVEPEELLYIVRHYIQLRYLRDQAQAH